MKNTWKKVKIGDIAEVGRGSSPRPIADQRYFSGGTIPWIKIADATKSGRFLYETKEHVNEYGASFSRKLPKDSLIVAASGTLGFPQILGVEGCIHDGWLYIDKLKSVDKYFLYYALLTLNKHFLNQAYGAAIQNINTEILRNAEILLPPLQIQKKVALILSSYDSLVENNIKRIKILEEMAQLIYKEWFVKFKFPGHENVKIKDGVPEGWESCLLKDVVDFERGIEPGSKYYLSEYKKGRIPFLRVGDMGNRNSGIFIEEELAKGKVITKNDIAVSMDGTVGIVRVGLEGAYSTGIRKLILRNENIKQSFLYCLMLTDDIQNTIKAHAQGATILHASKSIEYMKFLLPTKELLQEFSSIAEPMLNLKLNLEDVDHNLTETRDLLLQKLMTGEVELK